MDNKISKQRMNEKRSELARRFWHSVDLKVKGMGISLNNFATEAGLTPQCMNSARWLNSPIRIRTAVWVCDALECPISELIYGARSITPSIDQDNINISLNDTDDELTRLVEDDFDKLTVNEKKAILIHAGSYLGIDADKLLRDVWL